MDKEDIIGMIGMSCLMGYMYLIDKLFPHGHPYRDFFGLLGMFLIFAYYGMFEIGIRFAVQKYPFIRMIVRPENRVFYLYIARSDKARGELAIETRKVGENIYSSKLNLAYPIDYFEFGKTKKIAIVHTKLWEERVKTTPGRAVFWGYGVPHPHTATIVCYRIEESPFDIEYGEPIPTLYLREAPGDYKFIARAMTDEAESEVEGDLESISSTKPNPILIENLKERIRELTIALAEKERRASYWHRRAIQSEELLTQLRSEMEGYKKAKSEVPLIAREMMLRLLYIHKTIEGAIKEVTYSTARSFIFSKWMALTVIAAGFFAYLYVHPKIVDRFLDWLILPQNQIVFLIALGIIGAVIYKLAKR